MVNSMLPLSRILAVSKNSLTIKMFALSVVCLSLLGSAAMAESEFPGRDVYPEVHYISLEDLHAKRNQVLRALSFCGRLIVRVLIPSSKEIRIPSFSLILRFPQ